MSAHPDPSSSGWYPPALPASQPEQGLVLTPPWQQRTLASASCAPLSLVRLSAPRCISLAPRFFRANATRDTCTPFLARQKSRPFTNLIRYPGCLPLSNTPSFCSHSLPQLHLQLTRAFTPLTCFHLDAVVARIHARSFDRARLHLACFPRLSCSPRKLDALETANRTTDAPKPTAPAWSAFSVPPIFGLRAPTTNSNK